MNVEREIVLVLILRKRRAKRAWLASIAGHKHESTVEFARDRASVQNKYWIEYQQASSAAEVARNILYRGRPERLPSFRTKVSCR